VITYLSNNSDTVLAALRQHVVLALIPVLIGLLVAVPIGYLGVRFPWFYHPLVTVCGILYSIPSLALFVFLPVILGTKILSPLNIVVALTIYTVALLARTVADGLRSVDELVVQSATAMGYRRFRRLVDVQLPIALPVILAGLRVATVANISLVSVGALIGTGGLGVLFTDGFQREYFSPIVVGIVLTLVLALVVDLVLVGIRNLLTPWERAGNTGVTVA
jgi:osmoprotectant transport system permease protein